MCLRAPRLFVLDGGLDGGWDDGDQAVVQNVKNHEACLVLREHVKVYYCTAINQLDLPRKCEDREVLKEYLRTAIRRHEGGSLPQAADWREGGKGRCWT